MPMPEKTDFGPFYTSGGALGPCNKNSPDGGRTIDWLGIVRAFRLLRLAQTQTTIQKDPRDTR